MIFTIVPMKLVDSYCFDLLTGNENLEAAVSWIVEHDNDPDIDLMPLVRVSCTVLLICHTIT